MWEAKTYRNRNVIAFQYVNKTQTNRKIGEVRKQILCNAVCHRGPPLYIRPKQNYLCEWTEWLCLTLHHTFWMTERIVRHNTRQAEKSSDEIYREGPFCHDFHSIRLKWVLLWVTPLLIFICKWGSTETHCWAHIVWQKDHKCHSMCSSSNEYVPSVPTL